MEAFVTKNKSKQKKKIATSSFSFVVARGSREAPSARLHAKAIASQLKPFLLIQTRKAGELVQKDTGQKQEKKTRALSVLFCGSASPPAFGYHRIGWMSLSGDSAGCGLSLSVSRMLFLIVRLGCPTPADKEIPPRCSSTIQSKSKNAKHRCSGR